MSIAPARGGRFLAANFAIWALYAVLMVAMGRAFGGGPSSGMVLIAVTLAVLLFLASAAMRDIAARGGWFAMEATGLLLRLAACIAVFSALAQVGIAAVLIPATRLGWVELPADSTGYGIGPVLGYWINTMILLGLWTGAWVGWRSLRHARASELAAIRAESRRNALELDSLRARLNPHFVFNALNNLRALITEDPERARELVTRLSNTLRHALDHSHREWTSLAQELAVVEDYLAVEAVHHEQRLRVVRHVDAPEHARLPPMALQLLVENAIKHGISRTPGGGELAISATTDADVLRIRVTNPGRLDTGVAGTGVGLAYLRQRLEATGGRFRLAQQGSAVVATLEVPQ